MDNPQNKIDHLCYEIPLRVKRFPANPKTPGSARHKLHRRTYTIITLIFIAGLFRLIIPSINIIIIAIKGIKIYLKKYLLLKKFPFVSFRIYIVLVVVNIIK